MAAAARDSSVPHPVAVVAISPWADLALTGDSMTKRAKNDSLLTQSALEQARFSYLGETNPKDPQASPLYGDLAGLSPVMLHVGEDEILLDDARRMSPIDPTRTEITANIARPLLGMIGKKCFATNAGPIALTA